MLADMFVSIAMIATQVRRKFGEQGDDVAAVFHRRNTTISALVIVLLLDFGNGRSDFGDRHRDSAIWFRLALILRPGFQRREQSQDKMACRMDELPATRRMIAFCRNQAIKCQPCSESGPSDNRAASSGMQWRHFADAVQPCLVIAAFLNLDISCRRIDPISDLNGYGLCLLTLS